MKRVFLLIFFNTLAAIPHSPVVVEGGISLTFPDAQKLQIVVADRSIIEWPQFSIQAQESVEFIQPTRTASVLNRVIGEDPSLLLGRLSGNGQVILINPNGILVGSNAVVNTANFIASTLDLQNNIYLAGGELLFSGSKGTIDFRGAVHTSGDTVLLGESVFHFGRIEAKNAALISGSEAALSSGIEGIYIRSKLNANQGELSMQGNLFSPGGNVFLVADTVNLQSGTVDVSCINSGGNIYVGGSYQGKNSDIPSSQRSFVGNEVLLKASGIADSDGGQVVVWSRGNTEFYGKIEAVGRHGGRAEVSGLKGLSYKGYTDLRPSSFNGSFGTLLLDPSDISIQDTMGGGSMPPFVPPTYDPVVVFAILDITELNTALGAANVLVQTNAGVGGNGDITLESSALAGINWSADSKLTLSAQRHLTINNNIIANSSYTGLGDQIELIADSGNSGTGDLTLYQTMGSIQIATSSGSISLRGANINIGNPMVTSNVIVDAAGLTGSITFSTPGTIFLQSPGVGFMGFAQVSSSQGQTINAGNWTILGPGDFGIGTPTTWLATGPVTAIVTGNTLFQGVNTGAAPDSVRVDVQSLNLTTNNLSVLGGPLDNTNAYIISAGAQTLNVGNLFTVRGGNGNTSHARISGGSQIIQAVNLEMYGGLAPMGMAPNANAEINSNGTQNVTVTNSIVMTPGDSNTTHCIIQASGDQTIICPTVTMLGGNSVQNSESIITCTIGHQLVNTDTLTMIGGVTPGQNGAGCHMNSSGTQRVEADVIHMTAGDQINTRVEIMAGGTQVVVCATDINLTGVLMPESASIRTMGPQSISAININMDGESDISSSGLQTLNVANDFTMLGGFPSQNLTSVNSNGNQQIANIGGDLIMMGNGSSLSSISWNCGDDSILNVAGDWNELGNGASCNFNGGNNLTVDVAGSYTLDSTTGLGCGFSCSSNLNMNIGGDIIIGSAASQATQSFSIDNSFGGGCTIRGGNNLIVTGGSAPSAQSYIDVRSDYYIAIPNDILFQGGTSTDSAAYIGQQLSPTMLPRTLIAHNNISFIGGSGNQAYAYSKNFSTHQIRAGRDVTVLGGSGLGAEAFIFGVGVNVLVPTLVDVQAGRDIVISGGTSVGGGSFGYMQTFVADFFLSSGRNILLTGGSGAANNHALLGTCWVDFSMFLMPPPSDRAQGTFLAAGSFIAQNGPTGSIAYVDQVASGIVEPTFFRMLFPPLTLNNNGSLTILASNDITLASGFNASEAYAPFNTLIHDITIVADSPFGTGTLWSGTPDPYLSGTPLFSASAGIAANVLGGFRAETGAFGGGIQLTSVAGNIHLSSAEFFAIGGIDNLTIGPIGTLNNVTINSITGNITVDPFHNIAITNPVTTAGNVFMIAQNDISMSSTGVIAAGGSVELVCDNEAPVSPLVGPGAFLMSAGSSITAGSTLRIFTARQSQNSINGLLQGISFVPGTLFTDTNQERWCIYFPEPILGVPFTIFYKECLAAILSQQVGPIISEFLVDLNSYDEFLPGKITRFTSDVFDLGPEPYFLRRRQLKIFNTPKTILGL